MREKIKLTMTEMDVLLLMAEGNPGAITVIQQLMEKPDGLFDLLRCDDMNMRGPQLWVAFKDICGGNVDEFIKKVRDRDREMIHLVNQEMFRDKGWTEMARVDRYHR